MMTTPSSFRQASAAVHALDALVEVLVQRIAAVRGQHYVRPDRLHLAEAAQVFAAAPVGLDAVAGEGGDGALFLVYDDVHDVGKPREPRGGLHVRIYGVAVQHSRAGEGAAYELPPVVAEHRSPVADAWQDALAPAGKAREEVRLYEALGHQQLRFRRQPVDDKRRA